MYHDSSGNQLLPNCGRTPGIGPGFFLYLYPSSMDCSIQCFQGFQELWEGGGRGPLGGPEQQQRQPHPRDPSGPGQPVPWAGAPAWRHLSAGAAQPRRCHITVKPPLNSRAVKPPLHSRAVKPPLHSRAVKPPLCSRAVKSPLCSGAVKPPVRFWAAQSPLCPLSS